MQPKGHKVSPPNTALVNMTNSVKIRISSVVSNTLRICFKACVTFF